MKVLKKYWWCILFLLLLPFILNWVVTRKTILAYNVAGEPKDWIYFWATYFSAIASLAMVVITGQILGQNTQQLNQLKQQWKDEHTPELFVKIEKDSLGYSIVFENVGKYVARNIRYKLNDDYISNIEHSDFKKKIDEDQKKIFNLKPNESKSFFICPPDRVDPIYAYQNKNGYCETKTIDLHGINFKLDEVKGIYPKLKDKEITVNINYADDVRVLYKLNLKSFSEKEQDSFLLIAVALEKMQQTLKFYLNKSGKLLQ